MLKKYFFTVAILVASFAGKAQLRKIPAAVTDSFSLKFSNATAVEWKDKLSSFQAAFKDGKKEVKASFLGKGVWLRTETRLLFDDLPAEVKEGFKKSKYADTPVKDVAELEEKNKPTQYRITVMKGPLNKTSIVFSKTGQLVSDKNFL